MTRRILFVNHTAELGGGEMTLLQIAARYRERSQVVLLKDGPLRHRLEASGVRVVLMESGAAMLRVKRRGGVLRTLAAIPAVAATVRRLARIAYDYDLIYANSQKAAVVSMLAGLVIRKPVVWYLHDIMSSDHFGGVQRRVVVNLANHSAQSVIVNSGASAGAFVDCGGDAGRVSIAPSGVDRAPFDSVSVGEIATVRRAIHSQTAPVVGLFGRLAPWKGQHVLVEALARLEDVHAVIVGDALFGEDVYRTQLIAQAKALGIGHRLHWLGFRDDIPQLMRACDVVVHTSISPEPFGRVIVEAMMARRPVIASAHGASAELLGEDYPNLVQPGDPGLLAAAIDRVLKAPSSQTDRLIAANFERACARFSTDRMFMDLDQVLAA